jgi:hypothetical protein
LVDLRVEVMRLYYNSTLALKRIVNVRIEALSDHRRPQDGGQGRQRQTRLGAVAMEMLVDDYRAGAKIKDLAGRFGVHRNTVTELLRRHGVKRRES